MMEMTFWSIMAIVWCLYVASGWEEIEEWFWLRGARREIRKMEKEVNHERQEDSR